MFGLKGFSKAKSKSVAQDKGRKRYFAIRDFYNKKSASEKKDKSKTIPYFRKNK